MLLGALGILLIGPVLFFSGIRYVFAILPLIVGLAFVLLYVSSLETLEGLQNRLIDMLGRIGNISYTTYLFHFFVVYEGSIVLKKGLGLLGIADEFVMYCLCFPILMLGSLLVGQLFARVIDRIAEKLLSVLGMKSR